MGFVVTLFSVSPARSVFSYTILYGILYGISITSNQQILLRGIVAVLGFSRRCSPFARAHSSVRRVFSPDHTVSVAVGLSSYATLKYRIIPPLQSLFKRHLARCAQSGCVYCYTAPSREPGKQHNRSGAQPSITLASFLIRFHS